MGLDISSMARLQVVPMPFRQFSIADGAGTDAA